MRKFFLLILLAVLVAMLGPPSAMSASKPSRQEAYTDMNGTQFGPAIEVSPSTWLKPAAADVTPFKLHPVIASSTTAPAYRPGWALLTTLSIGNTWTDRTREVSHNVILPNNGDVTPKTYLPATVGMTMT
jgi:hypothetical protein